MTYPLAIALAHFLWEGALIAALLALVLLMLRRAPAQARYAAACTALAAMLLSFFTTLALLMPGMAAPNHPVTMRNVFPVGEPVFSLTEWMPRPELSFWKWAVASWIAGVALFCVRALGGWVRIRSLLTRASIDPDPCWIVRLVESLGHGVS